MTPAEIRAAIDADPALGALVPDTQALATALSVGRTKLGEVGVKRFLAWTASTGLRSIIEDTAAGATALRASSLAIKDVLSGAVDAIDLSDAGNMAIVNAWEAAGSITTAQKDELIGYATFDDPVTEFEVRQAIFADDGSLLVST